MPKQTGRVTSESRSIELAGTVHAAETAQMASRFGGFVSRLEVQAGTRVRKGDLLVLMDDRNLQAQRTKVVAGKEETTRSAEAAEAQKRLATTTFERIRTLYEKKSASRQEYEEALSAKEAAEASYLAALQRISQAQSDLQDVQATSGYVRILAPFDGIITSVPVDTGSFVNPGQAVVQIESPDSYQVLFTVEEELLGLLKSGNRVAVSVPAISKETISATVQEVNPSIDAGTRTFQVKATLPVLPDLRSGLSARVFLSMDTVKSLWIPEEFLSRSNDIETVVVRQSGAWRRVLVKSGVRRSGKVEILTGLNDGEEIGIVEKGQ